jgi:hypothetical protein
MDLAPRRGVFKKLERSPMKFELWYLLVGILALVGVSNLLALHPGQQLI